MFYLMESVHKGEVKITPAASPHRHWEYSEGTHPDFGIDKWCTFFIFPGK